MENSNGEPLENVSIQAEGGEFTLTEADGTYRYKYRATKSSFFDLSIVAVKEGYVRSVAAPFTKDEAGADVCVTLFLKGIFY